MIKDIFSNCMTVFSQTRDDENLKTIQQIIKSASEYKNYIYIFVVKFKTKMALQTLERFFKKKNMMSSYLDIFFLSVFL